MGTAMEEFKKELIALCKKYDANITSGASQCGVTFIEVETDESYESWQCVNGEEVGVDV